jgi:L-fucose mutarotase
VLKTPLLHPQILAALAGAGHGSLVLVADGNYPASTSRGRNATVVHLNLRPGTVNAATIVETLAKAVPFEEAFVMAPLVDGPYARQEEPPIWSEFAYALSSGGSPLELKALERMAFYRSAATDDVALVVVSGETRLYGNLLLRIGVQEESRP